MTLRSMTPKEALVGEALLEGDLLPLAGLLALEGDLHPMIQRRLRIMIEEWEGAEYGLRVTFLKNHQETLGERRRTQRRNRALVSKMRDRKVASNKSWRECAQNVIEQEGAILTPEYLIKLEREQRQRSERLRRFMAAHAKG